MRLAKRIFVPLGAVVLLLAAVAAWSLREGSGEEVPLLELRRQAFQQRVTAEGVFKAVRSTPLAAPRRTHGPAKIAWLAEDGIFVEQGEVIVRFDPTDHERELLESEVSLSTAQSKMDQTRVQRDATLNDVERDRSLAQYELDMAHNFAEKDPEIFSRVEIIEAEIDERLAGLRVEHAEGRGDIQRQLSASEMELHRIAEGQAEARIRLANDALNALEVRAPHDGIVVFVRDRRGNIKQVGDIVFGRQPIAELPALDRMQAEVHVLEADAGGLTEGQRASVVVEAAPDRRFEATIQKVARMPKPRTRGVPVQYFAVTLELAETDPEVMKPGQRVRATLILAERERALVAPRQAVFEKEGKKLVYRKRGSGFEPVPVTLGATSLGRVVLEEGVAEGDVIALRDPSRSYRELVPTESEAEPNP